MKPKYPLMFLFAIVLAGCKKDNDTKPTSPPPLLKAQLDLNTAGSTIYEYDNLNRLTKISGSNGIKTEYTYSAGGAKAQGYNANGTPSANLIWEVNKEGIGTRSTASSGVVTNYELNADGRRARVTYNNASNTIAYENKHYYNSKTAVLDSITYAENGVWKSTTIHKEYDMDKLNTVSNENVGVLLFGRNEAHPVKQRIVRTLLNNLPYESRTDFTYEFDNKNRIIKTTSVFSTGQATSVTVYFYID